MKNRSVYWWMELILGILLCILGLYTLLNPNIALSSIVIIYGIVAIVTGVVDVMLYIRLEKRTGFGPATSLVGGIFSILAGILLLLNPGAGRWIISVIVPIWFIAHCISRLANLGMTRMVAGKTVYYISMVLNMLGLVLAIMLLFNPAASAAFIGYVIGFYLLALGVGSLVSAFSR